MGNTEYAAAAYLLNNILGSLARLHGEHSVSAIVCGDQSQPGNGSTYMVPQLYARHKEHVASLSMGTLLSRQPKLVVLTRADSLAEDIARVLPMMGIEDYLCLVLGPDTDVGIRSLLYVEGIRSDYRFLHARALGGTDVLLLSRCPTIRYLRTTEGHIVEHEQIREIYKVQGRREATCRLPDSRPIRGWMHVACMHGGDLIAAEMHGRLMNSGLLDKSSCVSVSMVGDQSCRERLRTNIFSVDDRYKVEVDSADVTLYEWPALIEMWKAARSSDFYAFYVHTKGASNCRPDVPQIIQRNIRTWRDCMSHFVIGEHESAIAALKSGYDAAGPLYYPCVNPGIGGMFGGNFWWTTSEHLRRLPDPRELAGSSGEARMRAESWLCSLEDGRYFNQYWVESNDPYDFPGVYNSLGGPLRHKGGYL